MTFPANRKGLDNFFYPESVAIVGVSTEGTVWSPGPVYYDSLRLFGYRGRLYLVNRKGGEFMGQKLYSSLIDLPETPDLVICCINRAGVPDLIDECTAKGVKAVSIFTGGFSERNGTEGRQLEDEVVRRARAGGVRVLGPNCLGPYSPDAGFSPGLEFPRHGGPVGLICQSGGNAIHFIRLAAQRGVFVSKGISYGNASDVNETDLLEYMAGDPAIKVICLYLEGVKDGRRFLRVLRETTRKKPVVIAKGGRTEAGAQAAASHSGSLAGAIQVWSAALKQAGAIQVASIEELVDMAGTFLFMPSLKGRRVGLVGMTGGATVMATDDAAAGGLTVPLLSAATREALRKFYNYDPGLILTNPIDISTHGFTDGIYEPLKIMQSADVDLLMVFIPIGLFLLPVTVSELSSLKVLIDHTIRVKREGSLPLAVVIYHMISADSKVAALQHQEELYQAGIPVYNSIYGAARAVDRFLRYHEARV